MFAFCFRITTVCNQREREAEIKKKVQETQTRTVKYHPLNSTTLIQISEHLLPITVLVT